VKQNVPPAVAVVVVVIVAILVGWFMYSRSAGSGLSKADEEKYLKPLQMAPGQQAPSPPSSPTQPLTLQHGPGGAFVPAPPSPR